MPPKRPKSSNHFLIGVGVEAGSRTVARRLRAHFGELHPVESDPLRQSGEARPNPNEEFAWSGFQGNIVGATCFLNLLALNTDRGIVPLWPLKRNWQNPCKPSEPSQLP
jgi:hypothetical protein